MPSLKLVQRLTCLQAQTKVVSRVEIDVDGHHETKIYTTGSTVQGRVRLITQHQTTFQSIQISLRGTTSTRQDSQYGQPSTTHTFLNIQMPISDEALTAGRVLERGEIYNIPFLFMIPQDLSLHACNHRSPVVRERHLVPPPSLGSWMKNDFTDGSTSIEYGIRARLVLGTEGNFVDQNVPINVIPVFPEQPPIDVACLNSQYCLSQTKTIRRNMVGVKEGFLKVSTTQPRPIKLHLDHLQTSDSELAINLEYTPTSSRSIPPEIRVKGAAIEAITSFWTGPVGYLPDHDDKLPSATSPVAPWTNSYPLPLRELGEVTWEKAVNFDSSAESERRASEPIQITPNHPSMQSPSYTTASSIDIPYNHPEPTTYKATLTQSFMLPTEKLFFLPTFHSCMVSRSYQIRLTLAARAQGSTMSLIVPLQITSEGRATTDSPLLPIYVSNGVQSACETGRLTSCMHMTMNLSQLAIHHLHIGNKESQAFFNWWRSDQLNANFYGAYFGALAAAGGDHIVASDDGSDRYAQYIIYRKGKPFKLVLVNTDYYSGTGSRSTTSFTATGIKNGAVKALRMTGPSSETLVPLKQTNPSLEPSIGGQYFSNQNCGLKGAQKFETLNVKKEKLVIDLKASEALIVYL